MIRAVIFDIGETLVDRTREYGAWADWFGTPRHTFSAVFGAIISQGGGVREVIARFTDEDVSSVRRSMEDTGHLPALAEVDLYPDVRSCLRTLRGAGLWIGIAGNQPPAVGIQLRALCLDADLVVSSGEWGVAKPDPAFFARLQAATGCLPEETVYVGDQIGNDVLAAKRAGMRPIRLRRGPWGHLVRNDAAEAGCLAVLDSLEELPSVLGC